MTDEQTTQTIPIVLVDDHAIWRDGVKSLLEETEFQVIGEAASGREAVELLKTARPRIALLDIRMAGGDGLDTLQAIKSEHPEISVIMLTTYDNPTYMARAVAGGASGYLLKGVGAEELLGALRAVAKGDALISHKDLGRMLRGVNPDGAADGDLIKPLSPREAEVLRLVATGLNNRDIAGLLFVSEGTVKSHVEHIIGKIGVSDRVQAVVWAARHGVISLESD